MLHGILADAVSVFSSIRFVVQGPSMEPTLWHNDHLLVDQTAFRHGIVSRHSIVVMDDPVLPNHTLVKRIVGVPGESVSVRGGRTLINGRPLPEPYIRTGERSRPDPAEIEEWELASHQYFVLGDNREYSLYGRDSLLFGAITKDIIIGRVWFRYWPARRLGRLSN
ncbi:MAG: signal peptidase I [Dehalococcoidia bacterium]|nr:signal peptidase I [Dehalococcoidia bacterium]